MLKACLSYMKPSQIKTLEIDGILDNPQIPEHELLDKWAILIINRIQKWRKSNRFGSYWNEFVGGMTQRVQIPAITPVTWVWFKESTSWKQKSDSCKLSSDFHMWALAHEPWHRCAHMNAHTQENAIKKQFKKYSFSLFHFLKFQCYISVILGCGERCFWEKKA